MTSLGGGPRSGSRRPARGLLEAESGGGTTARTPQTLALPTRNAGHVGRRSSIRFPETGQRGGSSGSAVGRSGE